MKHAINTDAVCRRLADLEIEALRNGYPSGMTDAYRGECLGLANGYRRARELLRASANKKAVR